MTRATELLELMSDPAIDIPKAKRVEAVYADHLAGIESRLTPDELQRFIELGALIRDRSTLLIPVIRANMPETWPGGRVIKWPWKTRAPCQAGTGCPPVHLAQSRMWLDGRRLAGLQ